MNRIIKSNKALEDVLPNGATKFSNLKSYKEVSNGFEIIVWPEFIESQNNILESTNLFIWVYHIRIHNHNNFGAKLINRYWKIIDERGSVQEVHGEGVIGEQPNIMPNRNFQYSSGVHLLHPSGIMMGYYQMQKENGETFEIKIPTFSLDVPSIKNSVVN